MGPGLLAPVHEIMMIFKLTFEFTCKLTCKIICKFIFELTLKIIFKFILITINWSVSIAGNFSKQLERTIISTSVVQESTV